MEFLTDFLPFGHDDAHRHYQDIYHTQELQPHHQASFTHEAVAGAAGFAAMRAYESHLRATGEQPSHPVMKEILAGIAAAEVDKLVETKGLDWVDRRKAKKLAERQAHELADQRYGGGTGWEYAQQQGGYAAPYDFGGGSPWGAPGHGGYGAYGPPPPVDGYYSGYQQPGYQQSGYQQPRYQQPSYYPPPPQGYAPYGEQYPQHHHHHHHG